MLGLEKLQRDVKRTPPQHGTVHAEKDGKRLLDKTTRLKDKVEESLMKFIHRSKHQFDLGEKPLRLSGPPLSFCDGAILIQRGKADVSEIMVPRDTTSPQCWGFICKYCYLEVGVYSAVRLLLNGQPAMDSDMLAASHAPACKSFADRKAYYKCIPCYQEYKYVGFVSAIEFEKHSRTHLGHEFINKRKDAVELAKKQIDEYILAPETTESIVVSDEDDAGPTEVSPLSSPPSTPHIHPEQLPDDRVATQITRENIAPRRKPLPRQNRLPSPPRHGPLVDGGIAAGPTYSAPSGEQAGAIEEQMDTEVAEVPHTVHELPALPQTMEAVETFELENHQSAPHQYVPEREQLSGSTGSHAWNTPGRSATHAERAPIPGSFIYSE